MQRPLLPLALLWALAGCAGSSNPSTPQVGAADPGIVRPGREIVAGGLVHSALGIYEMTLDPATGAAAVELVVERNLQQSELYSLSIENFLRPDTLTVEAVGWTADTVDIRYRTKHPFPKAMNLDGPASASNREDLAVTGRVLWLIDEPDAAVYFAGNGDVRANTRWITNPDGYFAPGELLDTFGFAANAFPYQLLVDEALDNREDLSNGGSPTGNFGTHGWSKADFAAGITGYGIWGQGQASVHTLRIDRTALAISGPITLRAAIIVKYEDPRGGLNSRERRANRLPQDNPALFAYRMPHGALDVETIELLAVNSQFRAGEEGSASIAARVRDWDARATEAGTVHLAGQSDVTLVSMGESGLPQVDVSAPGLPGGPAGLAVADDDTAYGGDPEPDSGQATDELLFTGTLMGTPPAEGTYTALLRARDITDIAPPPGWETVRINLSPDLVNLGTSIEGASFAALRFTVEGVAGERPRAAWLFRDGNQTVTGAGSITVDLTVPVLDPSNTSGNYTVEVDFGDHPIETFNHNVADGPQSYSHVYVYSGTPPDPQTYTVAVNVIDGDTPTLQAFAVPPEDPTVTVLPPSDFTGWARSWGGSDFDMAMSADVGPDGSVVVGGMFRSSPLDLGGGSRTSSDGAAYVMKFDAAGTYLWDRVYDGAEHDRTEDVTVLADGSIIAVGSYGGAVDFGGGTRTQAGGGDGFVVKLTGEGNHVWDRTWGTAGTESNYGVLVDSAGDVMVSGHGLGADLDLGGGALPLYPVFLVRLNPAGVYQWHYAVSGNGGFGSSVAEVAGGYLLGGFYSGSPDFGGGPRPVTGGSWTDAYVVKIDGDGTYVWDYTAGGDTVEYVWSGGVAAQSSGTVWVGGESNSSPIVLGGQSFPNNGAHDIFLVSLDGATGAQASARTWGSSSADNLRGPWIDSADNLVLAGGLGATASIGGPDASGMFVARFSPTLAFQWQHFWPGGGGYCYGVDGDVLGNPVAAGLFQGTSDFEPGPGVTNLSGNGSYDGFVIRLRGSDGMW